MSKLKAYIAPTPDGTGLSEYYLKSEANKEISRQKYKRCLAMARWCASRVVVWATEGNEKKSDLYWKWKEKWLELAEKFKVGR